MVQQLSFRLVGYGQPACDELEAFVRDAKADDPFAPVTVVVHNNYEGVALRRELVKQRAKRQGVSGTQRGLIAVSFWTLQHLADELVSVSLRRQELRPVSNLIVAAAIRQEMVDEPGMFAAVADHSSTEASLARAYAELRMLRNDQRQRLAESGVARVREVVAIADRVWRRLRRQRYYDASALMEQAAVHLRDLDEESTAHLNTRLGPTALHLPHSLSPVEVRLVRELAAAHETVVHLGVTGNRDADRLARETCMALSASRRPEKAEAAASDIADGRERASETVGLAHDLFADIEVDEATADAVISVTDPDEEVRAVVRAVLEDLDAGVAASDIAVLIPAREPYARTLTEQLDAVGIAWNGDAARTLAESLVGRFVLSLMRLVVDQRMRRVDVMALLAEAPVWVSFEAADGARVRAPAPAAAWERLARTAKVVETGDWVAVGAAGSPELDTSTRLGRLAHSLDAQIDAEEADPEASEARLSRLRADRRRCSDLAAFVSDLSRRISAATAAHTWDALSGWLREQVRHYLGRTTDDDWTPGLEPARSGHPLGPDDDASAGNAEAQWGTERSAAQRIDTLLEGLSSLSEIESAADASLMLRTLQAQLAAPHGRKGVVGAGVFVGSLSSHARVPQQRLYVLGLAEGIYPSRQHPDSLIGDADRHRGALTGRSERTDAQHRDLLTALACCPEGSTITVPRGDLRRNAESVPSRWLLPTAQRLAAEASHPSDDFAGGFLDAGNLTAAAASGTVPGLRVSHSFTSGLLGARFPASSAEYDSRALYVAAQQSGELNRHRLFSDAAESAFARGVALWRGRRSGRFTRFDGNLSKVVDAHDGLADVLSASRLEAWAACPRKYLFSYLLGIDEVVEPESIVRLSPIDRGQLIHESLDALLRELIEEARSASELPGIGRSYSQRDRDRLRQLGEAKAAQLEAVGATGYPLLWSFDRETMLADLVEVLARDEQRPTDHHAAASGRVVASEHRFGLGPVADGDADAAAVPFEVEPGRQLLLRGAIDRVERIGSPAENRPPAAGGRLVVIDYKSGSAFPYLGIRRPSERARRPDDPTLRGTKLQLGVYALAAAHHFAPSVRVTDAIAQAAYWFVSARADWTWVTRHMDDAYFARFTEVVRSITDGIAAGIFVGYVRAGDDRAGFTPCPYCDPDGIGTAEVLRQWKRKRLAPELSGFAHLAEGPIEEIA